MEIVFKIGIEVKSIKNITNNFFLIILNVCSRFVINIKIGNITKKIEYNFEKIEKIKKI